MRKEEEEEEEKKNKKKNFRSIDPNEFFLYRFRIRVNRENRFWFWFYQNPKRDFLKYFKLEYWKKLHCIASKTHIIIQVICWVYIAW